MFLEADTARKAIDPPPAAAPAAHGEAAPRATRSPIDRVLDNSKDAVGGRPVTVTSTIGGVDPTVRRRSPGTRP
ncbi:hypothetical protein ACFQX6_59230 [Streptosporangium lutulentum]